MAVNAPILAHLPISTWQKLKVINSNELKEVYGKSKREIKRSGYWQFTNLQITYHAGAWSGVDCWRVTEITVG
jgi:hypothetical protein